MTSNKQKEDGKPQHRSVTFLLAQVGALAAGMFGTRMAELDLTPPHAGILFNIRADEGLSQGALAKRLGVLPSRLVILVDELQQKGLIERRNDPDDRRANALYLTDLGRETLASIGKLSMAHEEQLCSDLSNDERTQLADLLLKIADGHGLTRGVHPGYKSLGRGRRTGASGSSKC